MVTATAVREGKGNNIVKEKYMKEYNFDTREEAINFLDKHNFKYYIKLVGCILVVILAFMLIYQIPIVKGFFTKLYESNIFFRIIVNLFKSIISVFKSTFSTKLW